jgi:type VI secretion system protein ImpH
MATAGGRASSDLTPGKPGNGNSPVVGGKAGVAAGAATGVAAPKVPTPSANPAASASTQIGRSTILSSSAMTLAALSAVIPDLNPDSVAARLFVEPQKFDFFQAVRMLERLFPDTMPVGFDGPSGRETVRFRSHVSLIFPPCQIWELRPTDSDRAVPEMTVTFFGMAGPSGIMPRHYTELLMRIQRDAKHDEKFALRDWFDLFTHRMLSLFYRAWEKYRFYISYERGEYLQHPPDPFTHALLSLSGLGIGTLRNRIRVTASTVEAMPEARPARQAEAAAEAKIEARVDRSTTGHRPERRTLAEVDDQALLRYSGLWVRRPRTAAGLASILSDYFEVPVEVEQFHGQWLQLDPADQSQLTSDCTNCRVGMNLVIGERVWDVEGKIRIRVGPLNYEQFVEFLPYRGAVKQSKAFFLLSHLTRLYIGPTLAFDVQLLLRGETVPDTVLADPTGPGLRLGWNSWLRSGKLRGCVKDAVFEGQEVFDLTGSRHD